MLCCYNLSLQGRSHIQMGKPCQDNSSSFRLITRGDIAVSIIADGVGSCKYAELGSSWAVTSSEEYIRKHYVDDQSLNFSNIVKGAFQYALNSVINKSKSSTQEELIQYDTTLTIAIFDGDKLYYGHSGDGGIIGLSDEGEYLKITEPQKGPDGVSVIPLRLSAQWIFGEKSNLSSVLLATDGVYDSFFPYLLKDEPVQIYVPLISYYMDNNDIHVSLKNEKELATDIKEYLLSQSCESIQDDMTVSVMINSNKFPLKQNADYYVEPDWIALKMKWDSKVYSNKSNKSERSLYEQSKENPESATPIHYDNGISKKENSSEQSTAPSGVLSKEA